MEKEEARTINDYVPEEILLHLFSFLSIADLCRSSRVCHEWHRIAQDPALWLPFMKRDCDNGGHLLTIHAATSPEYPSSSILKIKEDEDASMPRKQRPWKQIYAE